ncbi:MAG: CRTAC1 family protein [Planctomycetota bacterium]
MPRPHAVTTPFLIALSLLLSIGVVIFLWLWDRGGNSAGNNPGEDWFLRTSSGGSPLFVHDSGHSGKRFFPEIMGGGICVLDVDRDGLMDLYWVQGGSAGLAGHSGKSDPPRGNVLLRNLGNLNFEDITAESGVGDVGYGMGCACGDFDNDGDTDLYVTNVGPNVLYRNDGKGSFSNVTATANVGDPAWSTSSAFSDFNGDGLLDIWVTNYVHWSVETEGTCFSPDGVGDYCSPGRYGPVPDSVYLNKGDGTFADVSERSGVGQVPGNGLGIATGDYDADGDQDAYVANDQMPNHLWINDGQGRFVNKALLAGCALNQHGAVEAGMGVAAIDFDDDGDLDLFMSHLGGESNTIYSNNGGSFHDATAATGLAVPSIPYTGFGLDFSDFDHNGLLDLYIANGRVALSEPRFSRDDPYAEPNMLLELRNDGRFYTVQPSGGMAAPPVATSRGCVSVDLDNDGDLELLVVNKDGPADLLENVAGARGHWMILHVVTNAGAPAIGAVVEVTMADRRIVRIVNPAHGYLSSRDPRVHIGLGPLTAIDKVSVRWPDGSTREFDGLAVDRIHRLEPPEVP